MVARLAVGHLTLLCHCILTGGFVWPSATAPRSAGLRLAPVVAVLGGWGQRDGISGVQLANSERRGAEPGGLSKVFSLQGRPFHHCQHRTPNPFTPYSHSPGISSPSTSVSNPTPSFLSLSLISRSSVGRHVRCKQRPLPAAN